MSPLIETTTKVQSISLTLPLLHELTNYSLMFPEKHLVKLDFSKTCFRLQTEIELNSTHTPHPPHHRRHLTHWQLRTVTLEVDSDPTRQRQGFRQKLLPASETKRLDTVPKQV